MMDASRFFGHVAVPQRVQGHLLTIHAGTGRHAPERPVLTPNRFKDFWR
jgi:hypothetical protein